MVVETIFTQRVADRSDFPEQSKAQMRKAIVSEFEKLIDELEVAEKDKANQEKKPKYPS